MDQQLDNIFRILSGTGSQSMNEIGLGAFVFLLVLSLASSLLIAQFYLFFYANRATGSQVHRAFRCWGSRSRRSSSRSSFRFHSLLGCLARCRS